jgi:RIO kinase 1
MLFQNPVQQLLDSLAKKGFLLEIVSELKSGKEVTVYMVKLNGELVAMKLYHQNSQLKTKHEYLEGKFFQKKSEEKAVNSKTKLGKELNKNNWIKREFSLMQKLFQKKAKIPKPIFQLENAIFMELIGDNMQLARRLVDVKLEASLANFFFTKILENIRIFLDCGIVHGDLSAYNILVWREDFWIIDLPQAIDIRLNNNKEKFLKRDLKNLVSYFSKYVEIDLNKIYQTFDLI